MYNKKELIKAAKKTFFAYLRLDFAKEFSLNINGNATTYTDYLQALLDDNTLTAENPQHACTIGEQSYIISLENNRVTLKTDPDSSAKKLAYKEIADYDEMDVCEVLSNIPFSLSRDKHNNVSFGLPTVVNGKIIELGGAKKLSLYRSHLVTLRKMIAYIQEHEDINPMLVALTTGSGKTFVQGLWYLTLHFAKWRGIFAQPHNLVEQFQDDLKKLLPNELVDELKGEDEIGNAPFILSSYENLLDNHFDTLYDENSEANDLALIFDEQHQLMEDESRRIKLKALAEKKLCLFLTATPNKETFKMCKNKPVAVMSAKEKQLEGQGSFPRVIKLENQSLQTIANTLEMTNLERLTSYFTVPLRSAFEGKYNPPTSWTVFDDLRKRLHLKETDVPNDHSRAYLRKNLEMPGRRKILFLTDCTDELINIQNYINGDTFYIYNNGAQEHQTHGSQEKKYAYKSYVERHEHAKEQAFISQLDAIDPNNLINNYQTSYFAKPAHHPANLASQLDKTIYHNMVDLLLSQITGFTPIELNRHRADNLKKLIEIVNKKFDDQEHTSPEFFVQQLRYDAKKNPNGIDEQGAEDTANLLAQMAKRFRKMSDKDKQEFIDNWTFDTTVYDKLNDDINGLQAFTKQHRTMYIMKGKKTAETPIEDDAIFFQFEARQINVYDEHRMLTKEAKKRKRGTFEQMDEHLKETHYIPEIIPEITETIADNYFKLGLVGMYVSNSKWQGFNDINLHTVVSTIPTQNDTNNAPARMIQSIGRNRGLDPTITPFYFQSLGLNCQSTFDVKLLETTDDYYNLYFKADKQYQKLFIQQLAKVLSEDIKHQIYNSQTGDLKTDDVRLKWGTLRCIVKALRSINNKNAHDIQLSRSQLTTLIRLVKKELNVEIKVLKDSSGMPKGIMRAFSLVYTFFSALTLFSSIKTKLKFYQQIYQSKKALKKAIIDKDENAINQQEAILLYAKVLKLRFSTIESQNFKIGHIGATLNAVTQGIITKRPETEDPMLVEQALREGFKDYIKHPQFYKTCNAIAGRFSALELKCLINIIQDKNIADENKDASDLYRLLTLLKKKNYAAIQSEFIKVDTDSETGLSLLNLLNVLTTLQVEMSHMHKYYLRLLGSSRTSNDDPSTGNLSKLQSFIGQHDILALRANTPNNQTLKEVRHETMTYYTMLSGVNDANKIDIIQHQDDINHLVRIQSHILTPLWWSSHKTMLGHLLSDLVDAIKSRFSKDKKVEADLDELELDEVENSTDSYSTIADEIDNKKKSTSAEINMNALFNKAAYETGRQIRHLKQFTLKDVRKPDCKVDAIQTVLDHIDEAEQHGISPKAA